MNDPKTEKAIVPLTDRRNARQPGVAFGLIPWRRPAILTPFVDAVYAARDYFTHRTDDVATSKEPIAMPVARKSEKKPRPTVEATPSSARLESAVRKAASAKTKARDAKADLKRAKKAFRLARKAAKAARKEVAALQAAIAAAEERVAAATKRARTTRRAPKTDGSTAAANTAPRPPAAAKSTRRTRPAPASDGSDATVVYTEALATPADSGAETPSDGSS